MKKTILAFLAVLAAALLLSACEKAPAEAESGGSGEPEYGIVPCTYEETVAFIETNEAREQAEEFGRWNNWGEFSAAAGTVDTDSFLLQFAQDMYSEIGESLPANDGLFIAIPKEIGDKYLYKYFGINNGDGNGSSYYCAETNSYNLPEAHCGARYFVDSVQAVSAAENTVVYKCVFNEGTYSDSPTRFYTSLMTTEALKDSGGTFLRLVSVQSRTGPFDSVEEAAAEQGFDYTGWQDFSCNIGAEPFCLVTKNGKTFAANNTHTAYNALAGFGLPADFKILHDVYGDEFHSGTKFDFYPGDFKIIDDADYDAVRNDLLNFDGKNAIPISKGYIIPADFSKPWYDYLVVKEARGDSDWVCAYHYDVSIEVDGGIFTAAVNEYGAFDEDYDMSNAVAFIEQVMETVTVTVDYGSVQS